MRVEKGLWEPENPSVSQRGENRWRPLPFVENIEFAAVALRMYAGLGMGVIARHCRNGPCLRRRGDGRPQAVRVSAPNGAGSLGRVVLSVAGDGLVGRLAVASGILAQTCLSCCLDVERWRGVLLARCGCFH